MAERKLIDKVTMTAERHGLFDKGDMIVIGLSGGPDSLCLFDCLKRLANSYELQLVAVHVNHGLRPGAADEDQRFVEDYCAQADVPCYVFSIDCNDVAQRTGRSSEEVGREFRYNCYDQVAKSLMLDSAAQLKLKGRIKIAVAHNANDQAETVMFRMIRGTGTDGLAGMEYSRLSEAGFSIIRPLLDCTREEIEEYVKQRGLTPCIDATNAQPIYTRNKIRLEVLPQLKQYNPSIVESLSRLAANAQEDKDYFWKETNNLLNLALLGKSQNELAMDQMALDHAHPALRHRVIALAFSKIGLVTDITRAHLDAADALIENGKTGTEINFPHGYVMTLSYGKVLVRNAQAQAMPAPEFTEDGDTTFISNNYSISQMDDTRRGLGAQDNEFEDGEERPEKIRPAIIVTVEGPIKDINIRLANLPKTEGRGIELRTRRDGDFIVLKSGSETITKKLQDFFTDAKIPAHLRDQVPLLCIGREVLLVLGDDMTGLKTGLEKSRYTGNYK